MWVPVCACVRRLCEEGEGNNEYVFTNSSVRADVTQGQF